MRDGATTSEAYLPAHHPSHSGLLCRPARPDDRVKVNAIVVPTIRKAVVLRDAIQLGRQLDCPVVALCSRWSSPNQARALAESFDAKLVAVDLDEGIATWPELETATMVGKQFRHKSDLSLKRNLGLALAHMVGWPGLAFLDDDIIEVDPGDIEKAVSLAGKHSIVALENAGYPDNSVICHAMRRLRRVLGFEQDSFVGGGAMVVAADRIDSFFPNIYNEDWFFMLGVLEDDGQSKRRKQIAAIGKATQRCYDPFLVPDRARVEEFGDTLGEGLFAALDDEVPLSAAMRPKFWQAFLDNRGDLLTRMLEGLGEIRMDPAERTKVIASLKAALGMHRCITAEMCVDYMRAWSNDRKIWRDYVRDLPTGIGLEDALGRFGLRSHWTRGARAGGA